jgi:hypothetical protein
MRKIRTLVVMAIFTAVIAIPATASADVLIEVDENIGVSQVAPANPGNVFIKMLRTIFPPDPVRTAPIVVIQGNEADLSIQIFPPDPI